MLLNINLTCLNFQEFLLAIATLKGISFSNKSNTKYLLILVSNCFFLQNAEI